MAWTFDSFHFGSFRVLGQCHRGLTLTFVGLIYMFGGVQLLLEIGIGNGNDCVWQGASVAMDVPVAFIGVVLLPVVGNAAEHASAIIFAIKDKLVSTNFTRANLSKNYIFTSLLFVQDISLGVAIGSSTQISMFVVGIIIIIRYNFH